MRFTSKPPEGLSQGSPLRREFPKAPLLGGAGGGLKQAQIPTESCFSWTSSAKLTNEVRKSRSAGPNPRQLSKRTNNQ